MYLDDSFYFIKYEHFSVNFQLSLVHNDALHTNKSAFKCILLAGTCFGSLWISRLNKFTKLYYVNPRMNSRLIHREFGKCSRSQMKQVCGNIISRYLRWPNAPWIFYSLSTTRLDTLPGVTPPLSLFASYFVEDKKNTLISSGSAFRTKYCGHFLYKRYTNWGFLA